MLVVFSCRELVQHADDYLGSDKFLCLGIVDLLKKYNELKENTWLCDSGATCHFMNDPTGV